MEGVGQFHVDRDACKGSTNTPKGTTLRTTKTPEPLSFTKESMSANHICSLCERLSHEAR